LRVVSFSLPAAGANSDLTDLDPAPVVEAAPAWARELGKLGSGRNPVDVVALMEGIA
jgi:hypothetical protein